MVWFGDRICDTNIKLENHLGLQEPMFHIGSQSNFFLFGEFPMALFHIDLACIFIWHGEVPLRTIHFHIGNLGGLVKKRASFRLVKGSSFPLEDECVHLPNILSLTFLFAPNYKECFYHAGFVKNWQNKICFLEW